MLDDEEAICGLRSITTAGYATTRAVYWQPANSALAPFAIHIFNSTLTETENATVIASRRLFPDGVSEIERYRYCQLRLVVRQ